jgi:hypothetical protein
MKQSYGSGFHENLQAQVHEGPSDRAFGFTFVAFFVLVGLLPFIHHRPLRLWALLLAGLFLVATLVFPSVLGPLNKIWAKFGLLLSRITNPIVTGLMFYLFFTPASLILRAMGKDPLRLKLDSNLPSYWITRTPPGPAPESIRHQF